MSKHLVFQIMLESLDSCESQPANITYFMLNLH